MRLNTYQEKRKFNSTPEPKGVERKTSKFSFVVQRHYASRLHYDFRLEVDGVLKSWAVPKGPSLKAGEKRLAVMTEDHPLDYGSFFGTIPEGNYGAGEVEIWDEGTFEPFEEDLPKSKWNAHFSKQIENGDLKFKLSGQNINGAFALVRMHGEEGKNWLLIKKSDDYAVKSFKIEDIPSLHVKKNPIDEQLEEMWSKINAPMLATAAKTTKVRQDWIYENKYDGYRAIAKINGGKVELSSRNQNNFTANYPEIAKDLEKIQDNVVLDGELVILNENGISNFQKLQNLKSKSSKNLCFYVFDILYLNGHKVTDLPLFERKDLLKELMKNYEFEKTFFSPYVIREGQKFFEDQIKKRGGRDYR